MLQFMKRIFITILLWSTQLCVAGQQSAGQIYQQIPVLHGDSIVFPLTMINAFPFISVEVNGIKGKLMFDTGTESALRINENVVNLAGRKKERKGYFGSGQSFDINTNDTIAEVKFINGITYRNLLNIRSSNFDFLQKNITPDFIGYMGYDFFKGYIFKLDYFRRKITFYKATEQRKSSKDFLIGERLLAIINFELRSLPNHPIVHVKIGNIDVLGSFDTGQYGLLQLEENAEKTLKANSVVTPAGKDGNDDELISLNDIIIEGTFKTNLSGIFPFSFKRSELFRKALHIEEPSLICFGYRFLEQYKTIWDYEGKRIYILEK